MKKNKLTVLLTFFSVSLFAQQTKETNQELSKGAKKGMLVDAVFAEDGNIKLTYKMKVDKKSDQVAYEDYVFDKNLGYIGVQPTKETKKTNPDTKVTSVAAYVGGSNSFNVLSMNLTLQQEVWEKKWNYDRQTYQWGKRLSKESVKPKNNDSKYRGFASYANDEDGSVLVLASYDKGKDDDDQFVFLHITNDLNLKESKLPLNGNYSLVFCGRIESGNVFAVFAPNKGMADTKKYVIAEVTNKGELVSTNEFTAPSPNTLIMDYTEIKGDLFFVAGSDKSNDPYNEVFTSFAPIDNPGYSTGANKQMDKYEKRVFGHEFDNFHLLRISKGQLVFASTTPVKDFKAKVVTPPSQKKSSPYEGKKMVIQNIVVTPAGDYLIAGQLNDKKITNNGSNYSYKFYDYVCLQFDKNGTLKAQYAVEKVFDDSKNESYAGSQSFVLSADGSTAYWELMEIKVVKYYESIADAYNGSSSEAPHYFPRIAKINLTATTLSDFTGLGEKGKFLVYRYHTSITDDKTNTRYYIGHDDDYEKIWLGKYSFE